MSDSGDDDARHLAYAVPAAEGASIRVAPFDEMLRAFLGCTVVGGLTSGVTGVPYFLALRDRVAMDWPREGSLFFLFGCGIGAAVGAGALGGLVAARRVLGERGVLAAIVSVIFAMLGVAIVGVVPGAIGTAYFGAKQAPFMGVAAISVVPFSGAVVSAAFVARADARAHERDVGWGFVVVASFVSLVPVALVGVAIALVVPDEVALDVLRSAAKDLARGPDGFSGGLARMGGGIGALLGAALGLHAGLATVLSRARAVAWDDAP